MSDGFLYGLVVLSAIATILNIAALVLFPPKRKSLLRRVQVFTGLYAVVTLLLAYHALTKGGL